MSKFEKCTWDKILSLENNITLVEWLKKYWLVIILPVIYIAFIFPFLTDQISSNNHNLIITLTTVENWLQDGIFSHNFNLINAWNNPGDLNVHYYERVMNDQGRNYFVSYPPLSFILFYGFVTLFHCKNLVVSFKLFGVIIHLLSYFILLLVLKKKTSFLTAILLSSMFLFFPSSAVLSLMYYPEQLILLILLLLLFTLEGEKTLLKKCCVFLIGIGLVYCDWLGVLIVGSTMFFTVFIARDQLEKSTYYLFGGAICGGVLLLFQYIQINGFEALFHGLKVRYLERSGVFSETYSDRGVNLYNYRMLHYIGTHLFPTIIGSLVCVFTLCAIRKIEWKNQWVWIVLIPIGVHMLVLFNSNILHFQNLSKLSVFLIGLCLLMLKKQAVKPKFFLLLLSFNTLFSFYIVSNYLDRYEPSKALYQKAAFVRKHNDEDAVMILKQDGYSDDLVLLSYLCKRNLIWAENIDAAKELEQKRPIVLLDWSTKQVALLNQD